MKVLIVTFDPPAGSGGIEGRTMAYTIGLRRLGAAVEVAAISPARRATQEAYLGTRLTRLSSSAALLPRTVIELIRLMERSSINTVFFLSGGSTVAGILATCLIRLTRRRSVIFFYGMDVLIARSTPMGRVRLKASAMLAQKVIVNSKFTSGLFPFSLKSPPSVVYPGVDIDAARGFASGSRGSLSPPRILFVGRLVRRKGADVLLKAFSQLGNQFPGLRLDVVGDGPETTHLKSLAEQLGIAGSVTFYGTRQGKSLWERYSDATIFVMPSRASPTDVEGFGTVFLEAGAFGVPSIGTRTGGIPEAIDEGMTGLLVAADDVEGLRDCISGLLRDPVEMRRMGEQARQKAARFTWAASTGKVMEALS